MRSDGRGHQDAGADLLGLASLRVGVCLALLLEDSVGGALDAAGRPEELLIYPELLPGWLPLGFGSTLVLVWIVRILAFTALLGYRTQVSLMALAILGALLLGSAQLVGPTVHNMHLLWFVGLLALSPAGRVASLDAYLARRTSGPFESTSAGAARPALLFARMLLATVYFFPGAWKLLSAGTAWASAERLIPLFHSKWYQFNFVPVFRIDHYPHLLEAGAWGILALELSFPVLIWSTMGRWLALIGGLSFHLVSAQLLGIRFMPLWLCYGVLIDWPRVIDWITDAEPSSDRAAASESTNPSEPAKSNEQPGIVRRLSELPAVGWLGLAILVGQCVQGVRGQMQSWPVACYPTFHRPVSASIPDVLLIVSGAHSHEEVRVPSADEARRRSQAAWGRAWDLLGSS